MNSLGPETAEHCESRTVKSSRKSSPCSLHLWGTSAWCWPPPGEGFSYKVSALYHKIVAMCCDFVQCNARSSVPTTVTENCQDNRPQREEMHYWNVLCMKCINVWKWSSNNLWQHEKVINFSGNQLISCRYTVLTTVHHPDAINLSLNKLWICGGWLSCQFCLNLY